MTLKSEVAELRYEVAELSSGELRLTFTTGKVKPESTDLPMHTYVSGCPTMGSAIPAFLTAIQVIICLYLISTALLLTKV